MIIRPFQKLPPSTASFQSFRDVELYVRQLWDALYKARRGKLECVTELTLTAGAATTVLTDERLTIQSFVSLDPKTANAATELANGTVYCLTANRGTGTWTFTHANNAQVDRSYQVCIIG